MRAAAEDRIADRAASVDRRARADGGGGDHDVSRVADDRRGDAGARQCADWQTEILREVTIQIRPGTGRDLDAAVKAATDCALLLRVFRMCGLIPRRNPRSCLSPGSARACCRAILPVPRVIVVKLASGASPTSPRMRKALIDKVPGASLDDHRGWIDRMRAMARFRDGSAVLSCSGL